MTTFFFILENERVFFPLSFSSFLNKKWGNGENAPILSEKISISSEVCKIPREENKVPREEIWKTSDKITQTSRYFFKTTRRFFENKRKFRKKRPTTEQKPPKFAIFKTAENRVFPNNFFLVRISALNGGVENVNKSQILRLLAKSTTSSWTSFWRHSPKVFRNYPTKSGKQQSLPRKLCVYL